MAGTSFTEWEKVAEGRKLASGRLPHILRVPTVRDGREVLLRYVKDGSRVLDIGANDRNVGRFLKEKGLRADYRSLDIDRTHEHDYYDLSEVEGRFDVAVAFEVIEHMSVKDVVECFVRTRGLLNDGGTFVVSTPNVCHPAVFWRDCTHITPFRYDELCGLLASAGFSDTEVYRVAKMSLKERLLSLYYRPLLRFMRMDFAPGIVAVARAGSRGKDG